MKKLKQFFTGLKVFYYLIRLAIFPGKNIYTVIKLGNVISQSEAAKKATQKVMEDDRAKQLVQQRYGAGIPTIESLLSYPENSFGYTLGKFMQTNELGCYPIPIDPNYSDEVYVRERRRQLHDIIHVAMGWDTSLEGEAKVNAFVVGQAAFPISIIISAGVLIIGIFKFPGRIQQIYHDLVDAHLLGKNSRSIFSIKWEEVLDQPIEHIRALLEVEPQTALGTQGN